MLTDTEKAALVEEIESILRGCTIIANMDDDEPQTEVSDGTINTMAYSLLPIIKRLLAERDVDALLDGFANVNIMVAANGGYTKSGKWVVEFSYGGTPEHGGGHEAGVGETMTAAIADAVRSAKEAQGMSDASKRIMAQQLSLDYSDDGLRIIAEGK